MKRLETLNPELKILCSIKQRKALKNGEAPIFIRINYLGDRDEFSIKESTPVEDWDKKTSRLKRNHPRATEINAKIDSLIQKIHFAKEMLEQESISVNAKSIKDKITGKREQQHTVVKTFTKHNDEARALIGIDFAADTVQRYETTLMHFKAFINKTYKREDLSFKEITPTHIRDFEVYFKTTRNCCHNTTLKYLKNFKKIILIALSNGWINKDPFAGIKYKLDKVDAVFLNSRELEQIMQKDISIERLRVIRDVFIFCCYTGLAFSDVKSLEAKHFSQEEDGTTWIHKKRVKTGEMSTIFFMKEAREILKKYENHPRVQTSAILLPVPSNQKMNAYLKEIADICGVNKSLSTHTARHTFATTVTLGNNVSLEVVSKMLGHSNTKMTQRYARTTEELIKKNMSPIDHTSKEAFNI
jgi:site-specific recombinase XerD